MVVASLAAALLIGGLWFVGLLVVAWSDPAGRSPRWTNRLAGLDTGAAIMGLAVSQAVIWSGLPWPGLALAMAPFMTLVLALGLTDRH